jgi:TonB family protein
MLRRVALLALAMLLAAAPQAQEAPPEPATLFDRAPEVEGGLAALAARAVYPREALEAGAEGTVFVSVVVEVDGSPSEVSVLRGVHEALDAAAVRAVEGVRFTPAERGGAPIRARTTLPVRFALATAPEPTLEEPLEVGEPDEPPGAVSGFFVDAAPGLQCADGSTLDLKDVVGELPEVTGTVPCERADPVGGMARFHRALRYPEAARRMGAQGTVLLRIHVRPDGRAADVSVVDGADPSLAQSAMQTAQRFRYRPATVGGQPVGSVLTLPARFLISDRRPQ